jgi:hypothetical protein
MKGTMSSMAVVVCGLITSVATSLVVVFASKIIGIDIYTASVWGVIPIGAIFAGGFAASGYYFGCVYFNKHPDKWLLWQMLVVAALAQYLIYYVGYATLVLDDGRSVSDVISFGSYMKLTLTKSHLHVGYVSGETPELGWLGYGMAVIYFIGFLLGALLAWGLLRIKPFCSTCNVYLRKLFKRSRSFPDSDAASSYYDHVFTHAFDSQEFAAMIKGQQKVAKPTNGAVMIDTFLHACPKCSTQLIEEKVQVHNGKSWSESVKLGRRISVPSGTNLSGVFR